MSVGAKSLTLYQAVGCCRSEWEPQHLRVMLSPGSIMLQGGSRVSRAVSAAVKVQAGGKSRTEQRSAQQHAWRRALDPEHVGWDGGRGQNPNAHWGF